MNSKDRKRLLIVFVVIGLAQYTTAVNYGQCLSRINNMTIDGKMDNQGRLLPPSANNATAISYDLCVSECGASQQAFQWSVFSQQSSAWLLPWLALMSQLPFGANDLKYNLESMLLNVGSPVLAAYSLFLTALNGRWIRKRFGRYHRYPNVKHILQVLSSLQQSPLRIDADDEGLASLLILPQNDQWWEDLVKKLEFTQPYTWSISTVATIAWVLVSYIFTLVDNFTTDPATNLNTNGASIGTAWLWLLAVVFGWLRISPKCDSDRLKVAIEEANDCRYVADTSNGPPSMALKQIHPISLDLHPVDNARFHECVTAPVFNYARYLSWVQAVMKICDQVDNIHGRNMQSEEIAPGITFNDRKTGGWDNLNADQVQDYCAPQPLPTQNGQTGDHVYPPSPPVPTQMQMPVPQVPNQGPMIPYFHLPSHTTPDALQDNDDTNSPEPQSLQNPERRRQVDGEWRLDGSVWSRMVIASIWALVLQWGTTGAAILIIILTPTIGLGCRSLAFIIYGAASTLAWLMLLASSILVFYITDVPAHPYPGYLSVQYRGIRLLAIFLRLGGKTIAALNAIGIVAMSFFQFSGFFERCYCESCVLGLGKGAYNVITLLTADGQKMKGDWIAGTVLSGLTVILFAFHVWLLGSSSSSRFT